MGHHHHHHHGDHCCSCCCTDESCDLEHHHHHHHDENNFAEDLLELADEAWMEVLKEKIKDHIVKSHGKNMDKLAQLVSEANKERWKFKLAKEKTLQNYGDQLNRFFSQEK